LSAATGEAPNVNNQKIETPNATETLFERVSAPFDLEDVVGDIIANVPVVIDDSSNNNGDSAFTNVPLVQENFENPIVSHNQVLHLKSVPSTTTHNQLIYVKTARKRHIVGTDDLGKFRCVQ